MRGKHYEQLPGLLTSGWELWRGKYFNGNIPYTVGPSPAPDGDFMWFNLHFTLVDATFFKTAPGNSPSIIL